MARTRQRKAPITYTEDLKEFRQVLEDAGLVYDEGLFCESCEQLHDEEDPMYECSDCGEFPRSESANDNHQCGNCYKFGTLVYRHGCPNCHQEMVWAGIITDDSDSSTNKIAGWDEVKRQWFLDSEEGLDELLEEFGLEADTKSDEGEDVDEQSEDEEDEGPFN